MPSSTVSNLDSLQLKVLILPPPQISFSTACVVFDLPHWQMPRLVTPSALALPRVVSLCLAARLPTWIKSRASPSELLVQRWHPSSLPSVRRPMPSP